MFDRFVSERFFVPKDSTEAIDEVGKQRESWVMAFDLPEDIVVDILSRLPVKTLCRFKCVCKSWRSLISEAKFSLSPAGRERTIVHGLPSTFNFGASYTGEKGTNFYSLDEEFSAQKLTSAVGKVPYDYYIVRFLGTCNGLILFCDYECMYLWNPSTRCCRELPLLNGWVSRFLKLSRDSGTASGLCFDESSQDYKVVFISTPPAETGGPINSDSKIVYAASLGKRIEWKDISFPYNMPAFTRRYSTSKAGVLVRGHLHWIVWQETGGAQLIVYFDEKVNQFSTLPMPEEPGFCMGLTVLYGCLCMSSCQQEPRPTFNGDKDNDVFVMKEYGVKESWTKLFTIRGLLVPFNIRSSSELVLVSKYPYIYTYNLRNKRPCRFIKVQLPDHERPYNLRNECRKKIKLGPVPLLVDDGPLVYVESLAPVHWPEQ